MTFSTAHQTNWLPLVISCNHFDYFSIKTAIPGPILIVGLIVQLKANNQLWVSRHCRGTKKQIRRFGKKEEEKKSIHMSKTILKRRNVFDTTRILAGTSYQEVYGNIEAGIYGCKKKKKKILLKKGHIKTWMSCYAHMRPKANGTSVRKPVQLTIQRTPQLQ